MTKVTFNKGVEVPPGLNHVDMNERGERSGPLSQYGFGMRAVEAAMRAWEVVEGYCFNPTHRGVPPEPDFAHGPRYMLLFKDGLWRMASFGGLNGPPWYRVWLEGYKARTGKEAHLRYLLELRKNTVAHAEAALREARANLAQTEIDLEDELAVSSSKKSS